MAKNKQEFKPIRMKKDKCFLCNNRHPKNIKKWYAKKFKVTEYEAELELYEIDFGENLQIEYFKSMNIE